MTSRDFVYWLQGFLKIENPESITQEQTKIIKNHLDLVFKKETENFSVTYKKSGKTEYKRCCACVGLARDYFNSTSKCWHTLDEF